MQYFINSRGKITELNDFSEPYFHKEVRSLQGEYLRVYGADVPWFDHFSKLYGTIEECVPEYIRYNHRVAWSYLVTIDKYHYPQVNTLTVDELSIVKKLLNPDNLPSELLQITTS